jgi:RimJ/RimL family protein N-acetyltransferase
VTYHGERVTLRAREPDDGVALHRWMSDPETIRWWDRIYPPLPAELMSARLAAAPAMSFEQVWFSVVARDTGELIGLCGLIAPSREHRHAELAVMIGEPAYRGRGYGTDATRTLCRFAFDRMNLVRVSLSVFPGNVAGRRAYERVGFVEEGVRRQAYYRDGRYHDLVQMAVFPETLTPSSAGG